MWSPRFTKSNSVAARYLINGWQLSQITRSRFPAVRECDRQRQRRGIPGAAYTGSLNGSGGTNRVPFYPINYLPIDSTYRSGRPYLP